SSVTCCSSWSCSPMISASTWLRPCRRRCESTSAGFDPASVHRFSTGFLHVSLRAGGERPTTNVPSGRVHRPVVFSGPRSKEQGFRGKRDVVEERVRKRCKRLRPQLP